MMKRFEDVHVDRSERFSIGVDREEGGYFLSIPVSNGVVDYEEYYFIDETLAKSFPKNRNEVLALVQKCRNRDNDEALIFEPGTNRGVAT